MSPKRILVVDDEHEILKLLRDLLEEQGYVVDCAEHAQGAIALVNDNIYDAAILDFNLPDMNGVMLHRRLRQMDVELAANTLFASGIVQSDSNLDYYAAYGRGFLAKPFDVAEVLHALNDLWRRSDGPGS